MPDTTSTIFWPGNYYRKLRVEAYSCDIMSVAFKSLYTALSLVVPHLTTKYNKE